MTLSLGASVRCGSELGAWEVGATRLHTFFYPRFWAAKPMAMATPVGVHNPNDEGFQNSVSEDSVCLSIGLSTVVVEELKR